MPGLDRNQHYLRSALSLAYCARAAYSDTPQNDAAMKKIGWSKVLPFKHDSSDTQGFVAGDADNVVVSFRGTEPNNIKDWITDLNYRHHKGKVLGGHVHQGFWDCWQAVKTKVSKHITTLRNNNQALWFTGHSLGGALATLAARDMTANRKPEAAFTYGAPRVGDPAFAKAYNISLTRFVNEDDIVPHVPFQGIINRYSHAGRVQMILPDGSITGSNAVWLQMLRKVATVMVFGAQTLPAKSIQDHSLNLYVKKLANHAANKTHPLVA